MVPHRVGGKQLLPELGRKLKWIVLVEIIILAILEQVKWVK